MSVKAVKQTILALALASALAAPGVARAEYGIDSYDVQVAANRAAPGDEAPLAPSGGAFHQAGGHPYAVVTHLSWTTHEIESGEYAGQIAPDGDIKTTEVELPAGLVGNPSSIPACKAQQLSGVVERLDSYISECPTDSQVGVVYVRFQSGKEDREVILPIFNMTAPSGLAARFGINVSKTLIFLDASTGPESGYRIRVGTVAAQALQVHRADIAFWGVPSAPEHDAERCNTGAASLKGTVSRALCPGPSQPFGEADGPHKAGHSPVAFLTMPTSCPPQGEGEEWALRSSSWQEPDILRAAATFTHLPPFAPDESAPGAQQGTTGCHRVPFNPDLAVQPTQHSATSASGLQVNLELPTEGLLNATGVAQSHLKRAVVTLPEGMTINPSQADGLGACAPAQYAAEKLGGAPGEGCPSTSKVGTVAVQTPLIEETIEGNVYVAKPYENPFGSLLALYIVLKNRDRGLLVKLAGEVSLDQASGQITTTFEDLPQVPFESFAFKFREGPRAPLVTPSACGEYTTTGEFTPWSDPANPVRTESTFRIETGVDGDPCPSGGLPPFNPGLIAGSVNNAAGAFSPFNLRLFRSDDEQEITHFSIKLPPGILAKLAGVPACPDAAIAAARTRTGAQELESPSCPAASQIGTTLVGVGVGSVLTYVPGKIYYAGPYNGSRISLAAITSAKVGPFDLGTVVVRQAIDIDPETAEVFVDSTGSDPIPHIIQGVTTHLRDIRAYVNRPEYVLNPTNCEPTSTASTVLGAGIDFISPADDNPVTVSTRYQAADCASLGFKPKLALSLKGGTKRNQVPAFKAVLTPRKGDANIGRSEVILPRSQFIEQGHIETICTRVQFAAGGGNGEQCPPRSIYGRARAISPLLYEPLEGPVFLRANGGERKLPDLVAALHGSYIDINLVGYIDSVYEKNKHGEVISRIRNRFLNIPDAPVSKFVLEMNGGKKGLLVNSSNLCKGSHRAEIKFTGQNGKPRNFKTKLRAQCSKKGKGKRKGRSPNPDPGSEGGYRLPRR